MLTNRGDNAVWDLPLRFSTVSPDGSLDQRLRVEVQVDGVGMRYVKSADRFEGTIQIGLVDEYHPQGSIQLPTPVDLSVSAAVDSLDPSSLSIAHTNIPYARVRLFDPSPKGTVIVRVRTALDTATYEILVPVVKRRLLLRPSPTRIDGFGLESSSLLVLLGGGRVGDSVLVTLTTTRGRVEQQQIRVAAAGASQAALWSRGLGRASVTAEALDEGRDSAEVSFAFPVWFLVAIVIGGAVGSVVRQGWAAIKSRKWPLTSKFLREMLIGVLTGALVAVMQSVGIDILHFASNRGGEAVAGVIAAIGAILGSALLDLIKERFGRGTQGAPNDQGASGAGGRRSPGG